MDKIINCKYFFFTSLAAKIRISERNTKGKLVFLFISEREYLRRQSEYE